MGEHGDRTQWGQVPNSGGELWASDAGEIATLKDGGGFDILPQDMDQFGELYVSFKRTGRGKRIKRSAASMILHAFDQPHVGGCAVGYRDGDTQNLRLDNLCWERKGRPRVVELKERRCLGKNCGIMFMSTGVGHRFCPACAPRIANISTTEFDDVGEGGLPDEPLCGTGGNPHK